MRTARLGQLMDPDVCNAADIFSELVEDHFMFFTEYDKFRVFGQDDYDGN